MTVHTIEARLRLDNDASNDIRADVVFTYVPERPPAGKKPGFPPEIYVEQILPLGPVGPLAPDALMNLAQDWLEKHGGHDACCAAAEERRGDS
jgi:hypothetical protein